MLDLGSNSKQACDALVLHNAMVVLRDMKEPAAQQALQLIEQLMRGER